VKLRDVLIVCSAVTLAGAAGLYAGLKSGHPDEDAGPQATVIWEEPDKLPGFSPSWRGAGTLAVGKQIIPGQYLIYPDGTSGGCVWQRLKATDGDVDSILSNGQMARGAAPQTVRVERKDKYVQFLGGCEFERIL
jgi:hypothetical protein